MKNSYILATTALVIFTAIPVYSQADSQIVSEPKGNYESGGFQSNIITPVGNVLTKSKDIAVDSAQAVAEATTQAVSATGKVAGKAAVATVDTAKKAAKLGADTAVEAADAATEFRKPDDFKRYKIHGRMILVDLKESSFKNYTKSQDLRDWIPEAGFSYYFNKNFSTEFVFTTAKTKLKANALPSSNKSLGSVYFASPSATLQYHPLPDSNISPYVGAGVNYTIFYDSVPRAGLQSVEYEDQAGVVINAGVDLMKNENWGVNLDAKKIFVDSSINVNNGLVKQDVRLDPIILGVGVTYKFDDQF